MAERYVGNCILIKSVLLERDKPARKLRAGSAYGHELSATNDAAWPLDVHTVSSLKDVAQVCYANQNPADTWEFDASLRPSRNDTATQLLNCLKKTSGSDEAHTRITVNNGLSDNLTLELDIE